MIKRDLHIKELYDIENIHTKPDNYNIEDNILKKTTSNFIWNNEVMNTFLSKLQSSVYIIIDQVNIMRNFKNFAVHKFEDDYYN